MKKLMTDIFCTIIYYIVMIKKSGYNYRSHYPCEFKIKPAIINDSGFFNALFTML